MWDGGAREKERVGASERRGCLQQSAGGGRLSGSCAVGLSGPATVTVLLRRQTRRSRSVAAAHIAPVTWLRAPSSARPSAPPLSRPRSAHKGRTMSTLFTRSDRCTSFLLNAKFCGISSQSEDEINASGAGGAPLFEATGAGGGGGVVGENAKKKTISSRARYRHKRISFTSARLSPRAHEVKWSPRCVALPRRSCRRGGARVPLALQHTTLRDSLFSATPTVALTFPRAPVPFPIRCPALCA